MSMYTVNISLPKKLADLAHQQVKKGYYGSLSEVIRDALRNLFEPEVPTYQMTKKQIKIAEKALREYREGKLKPIKSIDEIL